MTKVSFNFTLHMELLRLMSNFLIYIQTNFSKKKKKKLVLGLITIFLTRYKTFHLIEEIKESINNRTRLQRKDKDNPN